MEPTATYPKILKKQISSRKMHNAQLQRPSGGEKDTTRDINGQGAGYKYLYLYLS